MHWTHYNIQTVNCAIKIPGKNQNIDNIDSIHLILIYLFPYVASNHFSINKEKL